MSCAFCRSPNHDESDCRWNRPPPPPQYIVFLQEGTHKSIIPGVPSQQLIDESKRRSGHSCRAVCLPSSDRRFPQYDQWVLVDDAHVEHLQRMGAVVHHVSVAIRSTIGMASL